MSDNLPVPVYSIFDRDIPLAHIRVCVIINPIALTMRDGREANETAVAGCEGSKCLIPDRAENGFATEGRS